MSCRSPRTVPISSTPAGFACRPCARQQRLEHGHPGLHRARGNQHLGHVEDVVLEVLADDAHAGDEAVGQHFLDGRPSASASLRHLFDLFGLAFVEALVHQRVVDHSPRASPLGLPARARTPLRRRAPITWPLAGSSLAEPAQLDRAALNSSSASSIATNVLARHARADAAANRKDDAFAVRPFEDVERRRSHFVRRAAHRDLERIDIAHQAHAIADALLHLADVLLLAPVQHVEPGVRQVIEAGVDLGVVVVDLHPVLRKRVADALQVRMRELHVVLFVDEADDVVEDEDALDGVAQRPCAAP